jgi:hypothetical protein
MKVGTILDFLYPLWPIQGKKNFKTISFQKCFYNFFLPKNQWSTAVIKILSNSVCPNEHPSTIFSCTFVPLKPAVLKSGQGTRWDSLLKTGHAERSHAIAPLSIYSYYTLTYVNYESIIFGYQNRTYVRQGCLREIKHKIKYQYQIRSSEISNNLVFFHVKV